MFSETSDSSLYHPNFPCPFCTKIFDEKAEVVEHLDTCDGTEDLSAMILFQWWGSWEPYRQPPLSLWCPPVLSVLRFKKKGCCDWTYGGTEIETDSNVQCVFSVKKPLWLLRILWSTLSITTNADTDTYCAVSYALFCTYFTSLKTTFITLKCEHFRLSLLVQI